MKIKVGINDTSYVARRVLLSLPFKRAEIVRSYDLLNLVTYTRRALSVPANATSFSNNFHYDLGINKVDIFHFINTLSASPTPWVVSFEHYIPRWDIHSERGLELLASDRCRRIIALSRFAYENQCHCLEEHPSYRDVIREKMCILHPGQDALIQGIEEKPASEGPLTFAFVGADFFRKGGKEILLTFERLLREGFSVRLKIVSTLNFGDYASRSTFEDLMMARSLISRLSPHVVHFDKMSNPEVLRLLISSDVGLLPTYDDTYGFSTLESQAAGCPVISTDVCALPETNNEDIGWLIHIPKDRFGIAHRGNSAERAIISSIIQEQLYSIIKRICADPSIVRVKAARSLSKIKSECRPEERAETLEALYDEALSQPITSIMKKISTGNAAKLVVGFIGTSYVADRNLAKLPLKHFELRRTYDVFSVLNYVNRRFFNRSHATSLFNCLHFDGGLNFVPLIHLVNEVSASSTPWVATFSHYLPRWNVKSRVGMQWLAGKACRKLIAISQFAFNHQLHFLESFPEYRESIQSKMTILRPSQEPLIHDYGHKKTDKRFITFTIVGSDFFRKGGLETLRAFERLIAEGLPVKLIIVSSLDYGDYASQTTRDEVELAVRIIEKLQPSVHHYRQLPNTRVLQLLMTSDIGLLPTYDDIFGYSVLEAQAAGCPVISTDVCALAEINNDEIGWLIKVPKDEFQIAYRETPQQRQTLSELLTEELYRIIKHICVSQGCIEEKGRLSLKRIATECQPVQRANRLEEVYREALTSARL